ncbi:putative membrane protein YesL [Trichococcus patagoniensis]|uniref:Putative membrane protein YesL n=1 Tax=Trichococcus patagoniensis TaxID=382641 RepID=A0A2T5IF27_9LACT|nr:YesL family protein [Trichococcus patagoniensis]PTQ82413.1 putative membrane protein YesL [Trichococcus patagoniensis]
MDNTSRDENKAWSLLEKVGNLAILNCLFLISSLPLLTFGTALLTVNQVGKNILDDKEPYVFTTYIKYFKKNFKSGIKNWILTILFFVLIFGNLVMLENNIVTPLLKMVALSVVLLFLSLYLIVVTFAFTSDVENITNVKDSVIKNIVIGFQNPLVTIGLVSWNVLNILFFAWLLTFASFFLIYYFSIGFALLSLVNGSLIRRLKQKSD